VQSRENGPAELFYSLVSVDISFLLTCSCSCSLRAVSDLEPIARNTEAITVITTATQHKKKE